MSVTYRLYLKLRVWGMLSVYLLGSFVAIVKMADFGSMSLGTGFYAFLGLMVAVTAAQAALDPHDVWERVERR